MALLLLLLSLLFGFAVFGAGTGEVEVATLPPAPAESSVVLRSAGGSQIAAVGKYTVVGSGSSAMGEGEGNPGQASVVRPGARVSISLLGAGPAERRIAVYPAACNRPPVASFRLAPGVPRWRVDLRSGTYVVEVAVPRYRTVEGATGHGTWYLGLVVDPERTPAVEPYAGPRCRR